MTEIPANWKPVADGMGGVWVARDMEDLNRRNARIDIIHVPAWDLHYETDAGLFTDRQIQIALNMFCYGRGLGVEIGKKLQQEAIHHALGLVP